MIHPRTILSLAVVTVLLAGCGGGSSNDIADDSGDSGSGDDQQAGVTTKQVDASDSSTPVYLNLETGEQVDLTEDEAAASTDWHLAFQRNTIQLNSGASGPGNVVGAIGADQADFYNSNGAPNTSVFLNATADSELEHLLAEMVEPSSWTADALISQFADDWYNYDPSNGNISANADNGWLVRSGEGDSYARMQVNTFDFPTRTGEGIKDIQIDFDVQPAAQSTFTTTASFTGSIPAIGGELCFDFDSNTTVGCDATTWDIKLGFAGRDLYLRSNSGPSSNGDGGVFGAFEWTELSTYTSATITPGGESISGLYAADATGGIFVDSAWYAYSLEGNHKLWPNYRVYLIDTDSNDDASPIYGLQVIGYYNDAGTSGFPKIRWKTVELTAAL